MGSGDSVERTKTISLILGISGLLGALGAIASILAWLGISPRHSLSYAIAIAVVSLLTSTIMLAVDRSRLGRRVLELQKKTA